MALQLLKLCVVSGGIFIRMIRFVYPASWIAVEAMLIFVG
jgi:hypothetical protein